MQVKIGQQSDSIKELEDRIVAVTEEMDKALQINDLFTETKEELVNKNNELDTTKKTLEETTETLEETRTDLELTKNDRDEQRHLVGHHVETEQSLYSEANQENYQSEPVQMGGANTYNPNQQSGLPPTPQYPGSQTRHMMSSGSSNNYSTMNGYPGPRPKRGIRFNIPKRSAVSQSNAINSYQHGYPQRFNRPPTPQKHSSEDSHNYSTDRNHSDNTSELDQNHNNTAQPQPNQHEDPAAPLYLSKE